MRTFRAVALGAALSLGLVGFSAMAANAEEVVPSPDTTEVQAADLAAPVSTTPSETSPSTTEKVQSVPAETPTDTTVGQPTEPLATEADDTEPSDISSKTESANPGDSSPTGTSAPVTEKHHDPLVTEWNTFLINAPGTFPLGHVSLDHTAFEPRQTWLASGQVQPACGQYAQQDNATGTREVIDAIIAAGIGWADGHADDNNVKGYQINDWVIVYGGDCPPVIPDKPADIVTHDSSSATDCTTKLITTHHTTTTVGHELDTATNTWVALEPVTTNDADTTQPTTAKECPAVVVPPTNPPATSTPQSPQAAAFVTPSVDRLAQTGSDQETAWYILAASLVGLGLLLTFGRRWFQRHGDKTPYVD